MLLLPSSNSHSRPASSFTAASRRNAARLVLRNRSRSIRRPIIKKRQPSSRVMSSRAKPDKAASDITRRLRKSSSSPKSGSSVSRLMVSRCSSTSACQFSRDSLPRTCDAAHCRRCRLARRLKTPSSPNSPASKRSCSSPPSSSSGSKCRLSPSFTAACRAKGSSPST